jgi:glutamine synthetase type III|tara:strand:- start:316 stop:504 length:189 start_codon:yes stop_codon:yes gene_type:complete
MKHIESSSIDSIIVDLIIEHYNVQTFEGKGGRLSAKQFDEIVDVAENIYFKKVSIEVKPALA